VRSEFAGFSWDPLGDIAAAATDAINSFLAGIYEFSIGFLTGAFALFNSGDLDFDPLSEPFNGVIGMTSSLGIAIAFMMALVQTGRSIIQVGGGFGRLAIGLVEFTVTCAAGITILREVVKASSGLAEGILIAGGAGGWLGLSAGFEAPPGLGDTGPLALALNGILLILPAALLYLLMYLVHQLVLPVGACVIPVMAAGRLSEFGRSWMPMVARTLGAAAMAPMGSALLLTIGLAIQRNLQAGDATVSLFLGSIMVLLSPLSFFVIHRMLSFVDGAQSGGGVQLSVGRGGASGASAAGGSSTSDFAAAGGTAERRFAGAFSAAVAVVEHTGHSGDGHTGNGHSDNGAHAAANVDTGTRGPHSINRGTGVRSDTAPEVHAAAGPQSGQLSGAKVIDARERFAARGEPTPDSPPPASSSPRVPDVDKVAG
jgi:hypothetical protein